MTLGAGFHRIPILDYIADPAPDPSMSASVVHRMLSRSAKHVKQEHPRLNPNYVPENNSVMDAGSVAHHVLLKGDTRDIVVCQFDDWKKDAAKKMRDEAWAHGGIPILAHKLEAVNQMVVAAHEYIAESDIAGIFAPGAGEAELTMIWQETGGWMRSRPDWITTDKHRMLDYKSTKANAEPFNFIKQILTMGYDIQAEIALRGLKKLAPEVRNTEFLFLVQENEPPFACSLIGMPPTMLELAKGKVDFALALWQGCMQSDRWRGYSGRIAWPEPPAWALTQWEERKSLDDILDYGDA